jgi:hypothetical protein
VRGNLALFQFNGVLIDLIKTSPISYLLKHQKIYKDTEYGARNKVIKLLFIIPIIKNSHISTTLTYYSKIQIGKNTENSKKMVDKTIYK